MTNDYTSRTISVYDRIADAYADDINDYVPEVERKKFIALLPQRGSILDVGCAAGRDSEYFAANGFQTVGIDLSEHLLSIARKRVPHVEFLKQDMRQLQFPDGSFDGIWACAVLLHLRREEVSGVLTDCCRLLKPGGTLFVMVKKGEGEADVSEALSSGVSRHFVYYLPEEMTQKIQQAGCVLIESYTWNSKDRHVPSRDVEWISCFAKKKEIVVHH